jgi:WD40 repeat protein
MGVIAPDGTRAAWATGRHEVSLLALPSATVLRRYAVRFGGPQDDRLWASPLAFSRDGSTVLVEGTDEPVRYSAPGQPDLPGTAGVNAPAQEQRYALLDLRRGRVTGQVGGFAGWAYPTDQAWSADGRRLAVVTLDGQLQVLDAHTLHPRSPLVQAVAGTAQSVDWSPDGSTLVVGGRDGTLAFWDAATLRRLAPPLRSVVKDMWAAWYSPSGDEVSGLMPAPAVHPSRSFLVPVPQGDDPQAPVQLFTMPASPRSWLKRACALAAGQLTAAEWTRYVGTAHGYRPVC